MEKHSHWCGMDYIFSDTRNSYYVSFDNIIRYHLIIKIVLDTVIKDAYVRLFWITNCKKHDYAFCCYNNKPIWTKDEDTIVDWIKMFRFATKKGVLYLLKKRRNTNVERITMNLGNKY